MLRCPSPRSKTTRRSSPPKPPPGGFFTPLEPASRGFLLLENHMSKQLRELQARKTTQGDDGGDAVDWGGWQAWPKKAGDGYQPHSGKWCGAIHGRLLPEWSNYGSFAQDVAVQSGRTYRASAWFRASGSRSTRSA